MRVTWISYCLDLLHKYNSFAVHHPHKSGQYTQKQTGGQDIKIEIKNI